jgi:glycosyltransferase involved in cell wall biosynthesis
MMNDNRKICCFFNFASHYREEIYLKMEEELNADFYFGDVENEKIKKIDYKLFKRKINELHTIRLFSNFVIVKKSVFLVFKPYSNYIITGEYYNISTWFMMILNRLFGKKTYLWTHGWYGNETFIKKIIKKLYFSLSTGVFLYGDYAKNLMVKEGFLDNKLHVIYNSLDYECQLKIRNELNSKPLYNTIFGNDNPVIVFTGRITKVKKLEMLLEAQKKLIDSNIPINVFILGDGPEMNKIKLCSESLGIKDEVRFYGSCYDEQLIAEFYYNANICVSPGNIGLTGIHSMTYGCPVISHDNFHEQMPEFEVIVDGETGFFFQQNNIEDLVLKINEILKLNKEELRNNCFKMIDSKFNTRYQIEIFKNIIN